VESVDGNRSAFLSITAVGFSLRPIESWWQCPVKTRTSLIMNLLFLVALLALPPLRWAVAAEPPVSIEMVPKITLHGPAGSRRRVEWSATLQPSARWQTLTNVTLGKESAVLVDLAPVGSTRFYRVITVVGVVGVESMSFIPAGAFQMGDAFAEATSNELPIHTVTLSAYYIDRYEVTKTLWDSVKSWADVNGYGFDNSGESKGSNHPVHSINWYDAIKWCNARSERQGLAPAYYLDPAFTQPYRVGQVEPYVRFDAGCRLPTEAEWEKAARGGVGVHRFPWSDTDFVTHERANYYSTPGHEYDTSTTRRNHPMYAVGGRPYTSPVGSFAPNGYGLYDMAGNVWEWCWNRYGAYWPGPETDPHGPDFGGNGVIRGGSWASDAHYSRVAMRTISTLAARGNAMGFRTVLPARP